MVDLDGTNLGIVPFLAEEEDAGGEVREGVWEVVGTSFCCFPHWVAVFFSSRARPFGSAASGRVCRSDLANR